MIRKALTITGILLLAIVAVAGTWTSNNFIYKPAVGARGEGEKNTFDSGMDRVDGRLGKEIWVGDPRYGTTLQDAVTGIGSIQASLRIPPGTWNINSNFTIPANITLKPERGAIFNIATGVTLTVNGLEAGQFQIFSCTGTGQVIFGSTAINAVQGAWFGATGDGITNDTTAISKAINATPTGGTLQFTSGANYLITGDPAVSFNKRMNIDFNNCTFSYNGHGTALSIGGVAPRFFEAWCQGHVRVLRTEPISMDGSQTAASQLLGTGIKFSHVQNYVAKGSFYVRGFQYGYYFGNQATVMQIHGAQSQECLIDFYFDPSSDGGAFTSAIDLYSPFNVFNPAHYSSIAGSRGACFVKNGHTNDGHNIWGGDLEAMKERKLYVDANWCSFTDVYWDQSNGGTDIEFAAGAQQNKVDAGASLSLMAITDNGSNTDIRKPNYFWQDLAGWLHSIAGFAGNLTGNVTGNVSGSAGNCTGNAATATGLATPRAINGQNFDGSAAITVPVNNTDDHTTNADMPILFTGTQGGNYAAKTNSGFSFHPSTNKLNIPGTTVGGNFLTSGYFGSFINGTNLYFPADGIVLFKDNNNTKPFKLDIINQTTVNGSTSGTLIWSMPFQGTVYKKFMIYFNTLNDAGRTITYPTAFTQTPYIYGTPVATAVMSTSTTTLTLAASAGVTGFAFVEGY